MNLKERADKTNAVISLYRKKPFEWSTRGNCVHLAKAQAKGLGVKGLPSVPRFTTYAGAVKALKRTGFDTLEALMDSLFPRIAPARMIVGDIGMLPGREPFGALVIAAGGAKVLGWHEADLSQMRPIEVSKADFVAAWAIGRLPL